MIYLVTGAAGFIGYRFAASCAARGISVIGVDESPLFAERPEHADLRLAETIDRDALGAALPRLASQISAVIHLGACADTTETDVAYLRRLNVDYSQMLWNFCTERGLPFVYASSAATYGDGTSGYADDEAALPHLMPLNAYGRSKHLFDLWALAEERAGRRPARWAGFKFFNVYGYGERHKGSMASVVLHAFDQIRETGRMRLFRSHRDGIADGHQSRDFIAVEDVVDVLHFAAERDSPVQRGLLNLGTGKARTYLDLAGQVFSSLGQPPDIEFIDTPYEIRDRYQYFTEAPMQKLRALGWTRGFTSLEAGVSRYVERLQTASAPRR